MTEWAVGLHPWELYEFSDDGRCRNSETGLVKKLTMDTRGRLRVSLTSSVTRRSSSQRFHRVMWEAFNGPLPPKKVLVPIDDDWENLTLDNFEIIDWQTLKQRQWAEYNAEQDRIFEETRSEFDDYIFGSCIESEQDRKARFGC